MNVVKSSSMWMATPPTLDVFVAPVDDEHRLAAFTLADRLRCAGLESDTDYEGKSLKAMFKAANKRGTQLMLILGPDEVKNGEVKWKDFRDGTEGTMPNDDSLADALVQRLATPPE